MISFYGLPELIKNKLSSLNNTPATEEDLGEGGRRILGETVMKHSMKLMIEPESEIESIQLTEEEKTIIKDILYDNDNCKIFATGDDEHVTSTLFFKSERATYLIHTNKGRVHKRSPILHL